MLTALGLQMQAVESAQEKLALDYFAAVPALEQAGVDAAELGRQVYYANLLSLAKTKEAIAVLQSVGAIPV